MNSERRALRWHQCLQCRHSAAVLSLVQRPATRLGPNALSAVPQQKQSGRSALPVDRKGQGDASFRRCPFFLCPRPRYLFLSFSFPVFLCLFHESSISTVFCAGMCFISLPSAKTKIIIKCSCLFRAIRALSPNWMAARVAVAWVERPTAAAIPADAAKPRQG